LLSFVLQISRHL